MFDTIKTYALAVLGAIAAFGMFMWQLTRAKHANAVRNGVEKARKVERKATDEMTKGLKNEAKPVKHSTKRDDFK